MGNIIHCIFLDEMNQENSINRYLSNIRASLYAGGAAYSLTGTGNASEAWIFRDDIGAPHGIKGYEEQVNSVGMHHGHSHWPSEVNWNTFNSATLRRGFKVFSRSCQGCHGAMHQKYDLLVDKGFSQNELKSKMVFLPKVHPAH